MKRVNVGGQAVIEGVMMKHEEKYAVAIRKPDKNIEVDQNEYKSLSKKIKIFKLPLLRGMLAFVESMIIGVKTLTYSAEFYEGEEEIQPTRFDNFLEKVFGEKTESVLIGFSVVIAIFLGLGLFMVVPLLLTRLTKSFITNHTTQNLVEGVIRISMFLAYVTLISKMKDIKRVFQYHGAEHKTINCLEHEEELNVENVKKHSRLHKRCGTSFLLIVMIISVAVFMFVKVDDIWIRLLSRIVLIPIIAGLSYEVIRFAGKSENKVVNILSYPGMCLQRITTREPDDSQLEVAIVAVKEVLGNEDNLTETIL
ncbi:MAG: DUF1385 domain-containing protein [Eubacteriales bacterium]